MRREQKKYLLEEGRLVLYDSRSEEKKQLLDLGGKIENPQFLKDESKIGFVFNNNAFVYDLKSGSIKKITNIENGRKKAEDEELTPKAEFLQQENLKLLQVVNERKEKKESSKEYREAVAPKEFTFYLNDKKLSELHISPNAEYVSFRLIETEKSKGTKIPNFVDKSGYTVDIPGRSKVGDENTHVQLALYNLEKDTVFIVNTDNLPGITDLPDYVKDYPDKEWEKTAREVIPSSVYFSENGKKGIVNLRSKDNKDRWIAEIDLQTGELHSLDRQRDEAWIGGPGIGYTFEGGETLGWLPDNQHIYFQSEETGYSHLYLLNVDNGRKKQLTEGKFEVFDPFLSNSKKYWYLTTSEVGPGERHFYKMPLMGGKMEQLTHMEGNNQVSLSPDEKYMAIRHSYSNQPWELYLKKNSAGAEASTANARAIGNLQQLPLERSETDKIPGQGRRDGSCPVVHTR